MYSIKLKARCGWFMADLDTFLSGAHPHIFPKSLLWLLENTHTFVSRSRSNLRISRAVTRMFDLV